MKSSLNSVRQGGQSISQTNNFCPSSPAVGNSRISLLNSDAGQSVISGQLVAIIETSKSDRERTCEVMKSLGYKIFKFDSSADLAASLLEGAHFDLLLARFQNNQNEIFSSMRVLRHATAGQMPILWMVRETQLNIATVIANGINEDFILLPCNPAELRARMFGLQASSLSATLPNAFHCGQYRFQPNGRIVHFDGKNVKLRPMEFDLASYLFRHPGRVHSRHMLYSVVWGRQVNHDSKKRTLDVYVMTLRRKLEIGSHRGCELLSVRSVGYLLRLCRPQNYAERF